MKNIIKTAICLIVISSILLYSSVSHASTSVTASMYVRTSNYADMISSNTIIDDTVTPTVTYNYYTYEFSITPYISTAQDCYKTGYIAVNYKITNYTPTGATLDGVQFYYYPSNNNVYSSTIYSSSSRTEANVNYYLNNYGLTSSLPTTPIICRVTIHFANYSWTNYSINPTVTATISSQSIYADTSPVQIGMAAIIKSSITEALSDGELDLVYDYLQFWKTTQDGYLADIELSVDDVEMWLSYINSAQATLQNKVDLIYVLEQTFPGYFNSMISLLQQIRDMNASDTAAESQMQNAEQQLSQAVNDMEVQKPNINNVVNAGDQYMDSNITGAQSDTFFYLHGSNILVTILVMSVTIGILGFVIYGKSG